MKKAFLTIKGMESFSCPTWSSKDILLRGSNRKIKSQSEVSGDEAVLPGAGGHGELR